MNRALIVAVLVTSVAFAGCLGSKATARAQQDRADTRAREWAGDAALIGIIGFEGNLPDDVPGPWHGSLSSVDVPWDRLGTDPTLGDGEAAFWIYAYVTDLRDETFLVVVDEGGDVIETGTAEATAESRVLGNYAVDSDRAVQTAIEASPGLRQALETGNATLVVDLERRDGYENATWLVGGGAGDGTATPSGGAVVDAITGAVLDARSRTG